MELTGPLSVTKNNKNPGPGAYESSSVKDRTAYSLRAKFDYENKEPLKVPGPGTCKISIYDRFHCFSFQ